MGASPFLATIIAGAVITIIHKIIAAITVRNDIIGRIVKGEKTILFENKQFLEKNMMSICISHKDLKEEIRLAINEHATENIKKIYGKNGRNQCCQKKYAN